jgi:hypothetical protein
MRMQIVGAVAQLGERYVRNVEVRGSIPLGSTIFPEPGRNRPCWDRFCAPLTCFISGARLKEICQLYVTDLVK